MAIERTEPAAALAAHSMRAAFESRDHGAVMALLAPDVVLHSPLIRSPFAGRDAVGALFAAVLDSLAYITYELELERADVAMLKFHARVRGRAIEGVDVLRVDADGRIAEITVLIRPLAGLGALAAAVGPPLARRRGRLHALLMRALTRPLPVLLGGAELITPRLMRQR